MFSDVPAPHPMLGSKRFSKGLHFKCTPAQHLSGRGLSDKAKTLWSSWIIQSKTENMFFRADSWL